MQKTVASLSNNNDQVQVAVLTVMLQISNNFFQFWEKNFLFLACVKKFLKPKKIAISKNRQIFTILPHST